MPDQRGRPRRFPECPECGHNGGLDLYGVRKAGHIVNVYCECPACGVRLRYVISGHQGFWVRVRDLDEKTVQKIPQTIAHGLENAVH